MTDRPSIANAAQAYLSANLCALPAIRAEKRPSIGPWKQYQTRKPTVAEWSAWLANGPEAICILCGSPSGHTEIIDFDAGGELFKAWWASIPATLQEKLVVERTPSGGYHVIYRCSCAVCGNIKLAQRKVGDKVVTLIETRGEGGLFLCAPTPGYELTQGDLANPAVLSEEERDVLLQAAWELNEYLPPVANGPTGSANSPHIGPVSSNSPHMCGCASHNGDRPGDDFNNRGDVRAVLEEHGWVRLTDRQGRDGNEYWRRPGKPRGWSATLKECSEGRIFYVFSSNAAPFEPQTGYAPFAVYTLLEHGGDFEQAARSLRTLGFGSDSATHNAGDPNISPIVRQGPPALARAPDESPLIKRLKTLIDTFAGLNPAVIWNLLRKGETMNIIASPKVGKSWFVSHLAICVASGLNWLGMKVEQGRVLHIDNELHTNTSAYRYRRISEAMDMPHHLYSDNIDLLSLRGRLQDLYALAGTFEGIEPGTYQMIILDAFYRTLPRDTDENDNGAIANLYNLIDYYASKLDCCFVLIHHTSKGNQAGKAVTDVGAGAGSQSRAADTHLILRPHEEDGIVVLETAVRSWPPLAPKALKWNWPLFEPVDEVDTSALMGTNKPKEKAKPVDMAEFIAQCIGRHDPCSKSSVHYEAARQFDLPERKVDQMLDLALERGEAVKLRIGSRLKYVMNRPGVSGEKALWAAALLTHDPDIDISSLAETVGLSERHLRRIKADLAGSEQ